jgi:hypothetical protein
MGPAEPPGSSAGSGPDPLEDYCFSQDGVFVVPIDHLARAGIDASFAAALRGRTGLRQAWTDLFDESYRTWWARAEELAALDARHWVPPRLQHVVVVTAPEQVRPWFQPLPNTSWLVYASDFDPETSNREFGAYQLLQAERMGLTRNVLAGVLQNLGWWLLRSDAEVAAFQAAAARTPRPDAAGCRALGAALPWIRRLHDETLRPPVLLTPERLLRIEGTGLLLPASLHDGMERLMRAWTDTARHSADRFLLAQASKRRDHGKELCEFLREERPYVLVTGREGAVVWDPDRADQTRAAQVELRGIGESAAASLRADLEVVASRSRTFLESLAQPEALPAPHPGTEQGGLAYLHEGRRMVAYNLREPGMRRLLEPAPPFERLLLGARTVHEWCHLAADAGWVAVPADGVAEYEAVRAELAAVLEEVFAAAPLPLRQGAWPDLARLPGFDGRPGAVLAALPVERMPDWQSNLLASEYLTVGELETYVRTNVRTLRSDAATHGVFSRLVRYAYEFQYLALSRVADPLGWFADSTWFRNDYLAAGVIDEMGWRRLVATVRRLCACHVVDRSRFRPGRGTPRPA